MGSFKIFSALNLEESSDHKDTTADICSEDTRRQIHRRGKTQKVTEVLVFQSGDCRVKLGIFSARQTSCKLEQSHNNGAFVPVILQQPFSPLS